MLVDKNDQLIPAKVGNISILFMQGNTIHTNYLGIFIPQSNNHDKSWIYQFLLFKKCALITVY